MLDFQYYNIPLQKTGKYNVCSQRCRNRPKVQPQNFTPWFPKSELRNTACHLPARPACVPLASMEKCHAQQRCPAPSTQRCSFGTLALGSCSDPQTLLSALPCGGSLPASMLANCFPSNSLSCAEPVTTNHRTNWLAAQAHLGQQESQITRGKKHFNCGLHTASFGNSAHHSRCPESPR